LRRPTIRIRSRQSARTRSDPAFGVCVRVRGPNRRADHLYPLGTEDLIEAAAELRVAIVDQKPERLLVAELHHQVARLLRCPAAVGVRGTGDVLDPSRCHEMKKRTWIRCNNAVSTVRKSHASVVAAC
jgi:hypothetical protein